METRLRQILKLGGVKFTVIAPVAWFPFSSKHPKLRSIPKRRVAGGVEILHPRYVAIPLIGMYANLLTLFVALRRALALLKKEGQVFDLLDGHYYFPDGVVVSWCKNKLRLPMLLTARGTDINLIPQQFFAKRLILRAASRAEQNITVCAALKDEMIRIGVESDAIAVYRNGVNLEVFRPLLPGERSRVRADLGLSGFNVISVGLLTERKGHHLVVDSLPMLPNVSLTIVGSGELADQLKTHVLALGVDDRVHFTGAVSQEELRTLYGASDALVLASSREGWANVLLESLACGTPVVATSIWGTPEVVTSHVAGVLLEERTAEAIASGVRKLQNEPRDRGEVRAYAEKFGWQPVAEGLSELMRTTTLAP